MKQELRTHRLRHHLLAAFSLTVVATLSLGTTAHAQSICGLEAQSSDALTELMTPPITTASDADLRFSCLEQLLRARDDRRGPFATLYSATTTHVNEGIASGTFVDPEWTRRYLTAFAELYRVAFMDYETGRHDRVPGAWRIAFETAEEGQELIAQDLALGVNAHVDRDLAHALVIVGIGRTKEERSRRLRDHEAVNDVLRAAIDDEVALIAELYAPGYGRAPSEVMSIIKNTFFGFLVTGRKGAWNNAVLLSDSPAFSRPLVARSIELLASGIAKAIMLPGIAPGLIEALRQLEE